MIDGSTKFTSVGQSQQEDSVSPGIGPGYIVFPSHKKQCIYLVRRTAICMEHEKISSSAPGLASS